MAGLFALRREQTSPKAILPTRRQLYSSCDAQSVLSMSAKEYAIAMLNDERFKPEKDIIAQIG